MRSAHPFSPLPLVLALGACHRPPAVAPGARAEPVAPLEVRLAQVEPRAMPRFVTLTGSVLADRQSEVAANVAGRILATYVERGQAVRTGQALAAIDGKTSSLSATAAAAQLKAAEAQMAQAAADCERIDRLLQKGASTQAEHDRLKTQCAMQLSSADAARANAGVASKLAGDAVIRAPFDGVVGERYVNVGEYVQPPTRVASMYSVDPVRVSISVPEHAVGAVQRGQTVEVTVAAYPGRAFRGTVRHVAPALRPQTRDLVVEAVVPNPELALKPGMFATIRLHVGLVDQLTVPVSAVRTEDTVKRLFLARDKRALELVVKTGEERDGRVAVLDDIKPTDQVVVDPPAALRDGAPLR